MINVKDRDYWINHLKQMLGEPVLDPILTTKEIGQCFDAITKRCSWLPMGNDCSHHTTIFMSLIYCLVLYQGHKRWSVNSKDAYAQMQRYSKSYRQHEIRRKELVKKYQSGKLINLGFGE
jgi:hypothetical protein